MLKYCYTDDLAHPLVQYWDTVRDLDQDLTIPLESVIILTKGDLELINQIHSAWRNNDLLIAVIGTSLEYYGCSESQDQRRQDMLIRSLHYQHAHHGVSGPWLVNLRCDPRLEWVTVKNYIEWLAANRYQYRIQDVLLTRNYVPEPK